VLFHSHGGATYTASTDACARPISNIAYHHFEAFNEGDPLELSDSYLVWKTRMAELQSGEGHVMIDSFVGEHYINVTDTQTATSP